MSAAVATLELAREQSALLQAIFEPRPENAIKILANYDQPAWTLAQKGLKTYRANGHALAERALAAAYPVLARLIGATSFAALARDFWHHQSPTDGDIGLWGGALPGFVQASAQLADEPYLGDVARAEWTLHVAAGVADAPTDPASWALLAQADPADTYLLLAPGTTVLSSQYPVASVLAAHANADTVDEYALTLAGERLRAGVAETLIVWRDGLRPAAREALPGEAALVGALLAQAPLATALAAAPELDFTHWLTQAAQTGLLRAVSRLKPGF